MRIKNQVFLRRGRIQGYTNQGDLDFVKVLQPYTVLEPGEFSEMSMYLRVDSQHEVITANRYENVDLLAKVGGLYTSSISIVYLFISYFTQKLYFGNLIHKLYQHETVVKDGSVNQLSKEE
jgi:hypothetical protein